MVIRHHSRQRDLVMLQMNDAWAFNAHRCPTSVRVEFQREIERLVRSVVQNRDHIAIAVVTEEIVIAADRVEVLIAHALQPMINLKAHTVTLFSNDWTGLEYPKRTYFYTL